MDAFFIDPLKVGTAVISQVEVDDDRISALLGLPSNARLERIDVGPEDWGCELVVAGPEHFEEVRRLGEFRIMKTDGSYRSVAGRGVVLGHEGAASQLMGILASSGVWVSA